MRRAAAVVGMWTMGSLTAWFGCMAGTAVTYVNTDANGGTVSNRPEGVTSGDLWTMLIVYVLLTLAFLAGTIALARVVRRYDKDLM